MLQQTISGILKIPQRICIQIIIEGVLFSNFQMKIVFGCISDTFRHFLMKNCIRSKCIRPSVSIRSTRAPIRTRTHFVRIQLFISIYTLLCAINIDQYCLNSMQQKAKQCMSAKQTKLFISIESSLTIYLLLTVKTIVYINIIC